MYDPLDGSRARHCGTLAKSIDDKHDKRIEVTSQHLVRSVHPKDTSTGQFFFFFFFLVDVLIPTATASSSMGMAKYGANRP